MAHIETNLSTGSDSFKANRDGMLALIERVRMLEERVDVTGAGCFFELTVDVEQALDVGVGGLACGVGVSFL